MAIIGIGVDLVDISRIAAAYERHDKFVERLFTEREQSLCLQPVAKMSCLAGRFAAKEALSKALGTGIGKIAWLDLEILKTNAGAPYVILHGEAQQRADHLGVQKIHCSISHEKNMATAMVILEGTCDVFSG